jgi:hypothetical protein
MTKRIYIVDTGYLLELFKVPGVSTGNASKEVKKRFKNAIINNDGLFVPFVCICELGNHIAHVPDGGIRRKLVLQSIEAVKASINEGTPWTITPSEGISEILPHCQKFESYCKIGIGLTDTLVIQESLRLKKRYSGLGYTIHIWTKDTTLKSYEPETEADAFLG